eukprot:TRINITY_DN34098_c0_g1_i1.p1 TRINITY_DN34098_c0_g1~~TRINITY_DN34098_c0_g1_i1.p1  ORF type:complete len:315 (+),score=72.62 TRINITY_DN34098_c0_g1_i1:76-1020(+)
MGVPMRPAVLSYTSLLRAVAVVASCCYCTDGAPTRLVRSALQELAGEQPVKGSLSDADHVVGISSGVLQPDEGHKSAAVHQHKAERASPELTASGARAAVHGQKNASDQSHWLIASARMIVALCVVVLVSVISLHCVDPTWLSEKHLFRGMDRFLPSNHSTASVGGAGELAEGDLDEGSAEAKNLAAKQLQAQWLAEEQLEQEQACRASSEKPVNEGQGCEGALERGRIPEVAGGSLPRPRDSAGVHAGDEQADANMDADTKDDEESQHEVDFTSLKLCKTDSENMSQAETAILEASEDSDMDSRAAGTRHDQA